MMRPAKVQKVYLPKPVDFRKSINGLAKLGIKVEVFDPVQFVFLNRPRSPTDICDRSATRRGG